MALIRRTLRVSPMTRARGHTGNVVPHVCFDHALYSALTRQAKQACALCYETAGRDSDGAGRAASWELLGWVLAAGCARHDTHSALRWGVQTSYGDVVEAQKKLRIATESLKSGDDSVHAHLRAPVQ